MEDEESAQCAANIERTPILYRTLLSPPRREGGGHTI